jgi:sulfopyruvate decarboxylase subunit alpha
MTSYQSASQQFLDLLEHLGYNFFTGVPCSLFEGVTRILDREARYGYVSAVREDSALGLAAGAYLGGRQPVVFMQNSGLGVSVNAIVSLNQIYDIPALLVVSWRGHPRRPEGPEGRGDEDAPEHLIMGAVMEDFLSLLKIPFALLEPATMSQDVSELTRTMHATRKPVALVVPKGVLQQ